MNALNRFLKLYLHLLAGAYLTGLSISLILVAGESNTIGLDPALAGDIGLFIILFAVFSFAYISLWQIFRGSTTWGRGSVIDFKSNKEAASFLIGLAAGVTTCIYVAFVL